MCPESKKERRRTARVQHGDTCAGVAFSPLKIDNASLVDTLGYHFFFIRQTDQIDHDLDHLDSSLPLSGVEQDLCGTDSPSKVDRSSRR